MVVLIKWAIWVRCVFVIKIRITGLLVGGLVSWSKDLLKKLTIIDRILSFSANPFHKFPLTDSRANFFQNRLGSNY